MDDPMSTSLPHVAALLLFMANMLLLALYALTVSGHFPAEFRAEHLRKGAGALLLWATILAMAFATAITMLFAWQLIPWYAAVIGGGAMLLFAPLLLRPFPDQFVNGSAALVVFTAAAAAITAAMWRMTG
jgi:hypothetical protein